MKRIFLPLASLVVSAVVALPLGAQICSYLVDRTAHCSCGDMVATQQCAYGGDGHCFHLCSYQTCCGNERAWSACIDSDCIQTPQNLEAGPDSIAVAVYVPTCAGGFAAIAPPGPALR